MAPYDASGRLYGEILPVDPRIASSDGTLYFELLESRDPNNPGHHKTLGWRRGKTVESALTKQAADYFLKFGKEGKAIKVYHNGREILATDFLGLVQRLGGTGQLRRDISIADHERKAARRRESPLARTIEGSDDGDGIPPWMKIVGGARRPPRDPEYEMF